MFFLAIGFNPAPPALTGFQTLSGLNTQTLAKLSLTEGVTGTISPMLD